MAYPQGINFRDSLGFVTDGANEFFQNANAANYPTTTTQGNTVGWEQASGNNRDRNSGNNPRIAGTVFGNSGTAYNFRFDLPATGDYKIGLASGDGNYATDTNVSLFDTTTSLGSLSTGATSAGNTFKDATNTQYSAANWPGSNTLVTKTFTTTICRFRLMDVGVSDNINHAYVEQVPGATGPFPPWRNRIPPPKRFTRPLPIIHYT